ncbi:MAG: hypothetical protein OXU81_12825 [Gammaproteobacteria bacterium]|nr:hypothetical protein [Gammaproteobacteria bacterium]
MHRVPISILLVAALVVLTGCATTGTTTGPSVGPRSASTTGAHDGAYGGVRLDVIVPIFDPGLPEDPDDYEKEGVWPELRHAEANRFAVALKQALQDTQVFGDVRVSPDAEATGDLYVIGAIEKSNGQDVKIAVEAMDISGKRWLRKRYRHRVKEYFWRNPRNTGKDPYRPVFDEVAADVAALVKKRSQPKLTELRRIAEIRFAKSFSEDAFAEYVDERGGRVTLTALPARDDPMLERTRAIRVREGLFMDRMQTHYEAFAQRTDASYAAWQEHSLTEVKARNEARGKALVQGVVGAALAIGGAYAAIEGGRDHSTGQEVAGVGAAILGGVLIAKSFETSAQGKVHAEALSELGESLDLEVAPQVVELEGTTAELTGDAREQFRQWRAFLRRIYAEERTPEKTL